MGIGEILALLFGGGSLLSSLFGGGGGGDEQTQTTTSETTNPRYRSPALGMMEPGILSALLGNMQSMGGAGMPGGVSRFGSGAESMFSDVLALLQKDWPNIMNEYENGGGASRNNRYGGKEGWGGPCEKICKKQSDIAGANYSVCYQNCMKNGPDK